MAQAISRLARRWWMMPLLLVVSCDGGTRGSGISGGFSTLTGSLAADASSLAAFGARLESAPTPIQVRVREAPAATTEVDAATRSFTIPDVPAGDVTVDFVGETTASISLKGLPEDVSLHMVNVRFQEGEAKPAGFAITPDEGNGASLEVSQRKGPAPLPVTLNVADPTVPAPVQVVWDFGDGTRSGRTSTSHDYSEPGNYVVQATISGGGEQQRAFQVIQVGDAGERALEVTAYANPERGLPPLSVLFAAAARNNVGPVTYLWDFGDGSVPGEGVSVRHLFTQEGLFLVQVIAFDEAGGETADVVQIEVNDGTRPIPLTVEAEVDQPIGPAPHRVQLRATITGSGPVTIEWDFDDGSPRSTAPAPAHTYANPGRYFPTVTVTEVSTSETAHDQVAIEVQ